MREWIEKFVEALSVEKGFSPHTCRAYRNDLNQFSDYLKGELNGRRGSGADIDVRRVDDVLIRSYLGFLYKRYEKSTIARKLSALRSFFRFLVRGRVITTNPAGSVLTPKRGKPVPRYLPVDEVFRLLDGVKGESVLALRNRAILETLYSTGIRVAELAGMNVDDVDFDKGFVRVIGKGNKERLAPAGEKALNSIQAYLEKRSLAAWSVIAGHPPLLLNRRGGRLTTRSIARL
ncbi:MAG: tyrosine-type recombinase/integrase, partial [Deltaproteobacteria bacterium]|nr:tyrosine-type recombinase/integrase [Deltaproteobacteria bacterium]